jgi:hypothetical protein
MKEIEDVNVKTPNGIKADAPNLVVKPPPSRTFFFSRTLRENTDRLSQFQNFTETAGEKEVPGT